MLFELGFVTYECSGRYNEIISDYVDGFGFAMCDAASDEIITDQKGVFRTNCLDWYAQVPLSHNH